MIDKISEDYKSFNQIEIKDFYIIKTPQEFYSTVLEKCKSARTVCLACLVFGSEKHSADLLDVLEHRIKSNRKTIVFIDKTRNERNHELINLIEKRQLAQIIKFVSMIKLNFLPHIVNEFLGIYHDKAYIFDDEIIVSGANLDDPYFINRIDRYFLIKSKELCHEFKKRIFKDNIELVDDFDGNDSLKTVTTASKSIQTENTEAKLEINMGNSFDGKAEHAQQVIKRDGAINPASRTFIFNFTEKEEIQVLSGLFRFKYKEMNLSTAYLNFSNKHLELLRKYDFNLFTTSPKANTFNNFSFLGNIITDIYAYSSYKTKTYLPHCRLYEFEIPGYSFHSKGLWLFGEDFCVTVIGSSNFNQRSIYVDRECSSVIVTNDVKIIKKLRLECEELLKHSREVNVDTLRRRNIRIISIIIFYLFNLFV